MKHLLLIIGFVSYAVCAVGQSVIQGKISDQHQDLPSATVLLFRMDSTVEQGVATDTAGRFVFGNIDHGSYFLSVSMVGYIRHFSGEIIVTDESVSVTDIMLQEEATSLEEVTIRGEKLPVEQKIDRTVIHLQGRVTSSGNTLLEVLQKSPGIVINKQTNAISMNGKNGVRIMINGKILQVSKDAAMQMLEGMSSSGIERIELITNPSSMYDAEGNGGIIHIVSKEMTEYGTNATVGATLGYRARHSFGGNINIHHRAKKIAGFVDYATMKTNNLHIARMMKRIENMGYNQLTNNDSHRENSTIQQNLNAGFTWTWSEKNSMDLSASLFERDWTMNSTTSDIHHTTADSTVATSMKAWESNQWESVTGSFGFTHRFDKKNELRLSADYLYYYNSNPSSYDLLRNDKFPTAIDLRKTTPINTRVCALDYQLARSKELTIYVGTKYVRSNLNNEVITQRMLDQEWNIDPDFSSSSKIHESVTAFYISSQWKLTHHWQVHGGLRYEYTHTAIRTMSQKDLVNRKYGYLFPNFLIQRTFGKEKDFQFSYARRVTRPTYNDMAPYVFFWGNTTFSAGNTSLYPAISDAFTIGLRIKQWSASLQVTHIANEITMMQPEVEPESNNFIFKSQNLEYLNSAAFVNSYVWSVAPWWEVQASLLIQYQTGKTAYLPKEEILRQWSCNANLIHTFKLPKNFSLEITGFYQSKSLSGVSRFLPYGSLNAGIQKNFGTKGILRLSIDDILFTNYWKIETYSQANNIDSYFQYNWHNQFARVTYTYNFGNTKLRSVKLRSNSEEERRRIAN